MTEFPKHIHCTHFDVCSGCTLDDSVDTPPVLEEARAYFTSKGLVSFRLHRGSPTGWRYRAKLAIRGSKENPHIGLFKEGTHDVIDIPLCKVHHPAINRAVMILKEWIIQQSISPYEESAHEGVLRYAQLVVERSSGKVQLTLVVNHLSLFADDEKALKQLFTSAPDVWHSLWVNFNTRRDNVILGNSWKLIEGTPLLWEQLGETQVCFQPSSFAQANLDLFDQLLKAIHHQVPKGSRVTEYYAGVGVIGLSLAKQCAWVRCCEVNPSAEECFNAARAKLEPDFARHLSFTVGAAGDKLALLEGADVAIVDPPRKGLDRPLLKALQTTKALNRLVYVSCGWPSFKRDCEALLEAGWHLQVAEGYLFFPGSDHIELLSVFSNSQNE